MEIKQTPLKDCFIIENDLHGDARGFFLESFNKKRFSELSGFDMDVKQVNFAKSQKGVLRGLHYQLNPYAQSKLVGVISGAVIDVVVDLRSDSETFGNKFEIRIDSPNLNFFVPRGFAHGYEVLEDNTIFYYAVDNFYSPDYERGLFYADPDIGIEWSKGSKNISQKDQLNPSLKEAEYNF